MKQDCYVTLRSDILSWAGMQQHVFTLVATSMLHSTFSVLCASCKPQNYTDQHSSLGKEDVAYYLFSWLVSGPICDYLFGCDHSGAGTSKRDYQHFVRLTREAQHLTGPPGQNMSNFNDPR